MLSYMFYAVDPRKHAFSRAEQVPDYINDAIPYFFLLAFVELGVNAAKGRARGAANVKEMLCSIQLSLVEASFHLPWRSWNLAAYSYIYEHYRLCTIAHDSALCWVGLLLVVPLRALVPSLARTWALSTAGSPGRLCVLLAPLFLP